MTTSTLGYAIFGPEMGRRGIGRAGGRVVVGCLWMLETRSILILDAPGD